MEKKVVSKKKPKAVVKREEASIKDGEKEDGDGQTQGETLQERENSQIKSKPKSRKRRNSHEEDVIDGFLMVSYASLEDLEADGPIKPGAILTNKDESNIIVGIAPTKRRRESKSLAAKASKLQNGETAKARKSFSIPRKPKAIKAEKSKGKVKKVKEEVATITKPPTPIPIITEEENKQVEVITNAAEKVEEIISTFTENSKVEVEQPIWPPPPEFDSATTATTSPSLIVSEKIVSAVTLVENKELTVCKEEAEKTPPPRKPLSDFSINAIQGMRGSATVVSSMEEDTCSLTTTTTTLASSEPAEIETQTKSIATMTSELKQDKSISPMEITMRKETGFQFRRFEETKISATMRGISPIKSSTLNIDDTVIRKSVHHQIDLTGTTITSDKSKSFISSLKGREIIRRESRSRSPKHHSENRPPSSNSLTSTQESTKHQHQHQHIHQHQHQHSHQHQHFHPPFSSMVPPTGVFPPPYYGGMPYLPPVPGSTSHSHLPKPVPKPGKWCSLHVKIAHLITKAQKEQAERTSHMNPEALIGNRGGLHAFQAVPSRANYEREFPFHPSMRSHLSVSPKNVHPPTGGLHRASFSREPERHSFQSRHHPYFPGRDNLTGIQKRSDFEPPFSFDALAHPIGSSYRGLFDRERSSPPHLESMYHRRGSERSVTEIEKPNRLLQHERGIMNMSIDRETHHESERHRHTSFLNRDKSSYFQPVKVDSHPTHPMNNHGLCPTDLTRKPSPRRLSPISSSLSAAQKPHLRPSDLFERFHSDHMEHRRYFSAESRFLGGESRLFGAERRMFGSESRLFSSETRLLGASDSRLFGGDKRLPTAESRLLGPSDVRKSLLPFGHETPSASHLTGSHLSGSHSAVLNNLGRLSSKYTASSQGK